MMEALLGRVAGNTKTYIEDVFSAYTYTGNGSTQTINNGIDLAGKGGMVMCKTRNAANPFCVADTVRGATNILNTSSTSGQSAISVNINAFNSNGFTVGGDSWVNGNGGLEASWTFRKAEKFFDVVTWTGDGANSRQISHGLNCAVGLIFMKRTGGNVSGSAIYDNWLAWHKDLPSIRGIWGDCLKLNTTDSYQNFGPFSSGSNASTSSFTVGGDSYNQLGVTYVAYLFAHDTSADGLIQCGSFTTDASGNVSVTLGWEPQLIEAKATSTTSNWYNVDNSRGLTASLGGDNALYLNSTTSEITALGGFSINATGFSVHLATSQTYIYMAIRRGPMRQPTSGTQVYNAIARTGTGAAATVTGVGFPPDLVLSQCRSNGGGTIDFDRLRGAKQYLLPYTTSAEATGSDSLTSFDMDGFTVGADSSTGQLNFSSRTFINWCFRRYPGVFDVVCFNGSSSATFTVPHNLTVTPELVIIKKRIDVSAAGSANWWVLSSLYSGGFMSGGSTSTAFLNLTNAVGIGASSVLNTAPDTSNLYLKNNNFNVSDSFIGYLFSTLAGISKVFSYTGNGTSQTINCGFSAGARFIMIKRTDSTGDWFIWDTVRGIVAGNDPHLSLNTTAAEVTTDDSIDPDSSGFIVNQLSATNINVNGAAYIGFAIA